MELSDAVFCFNYDGEDFSVTVSGQTLRGCFWEPKNQPPQYIVVFVHDIGSFASHNHDVYEVIVNDGGSVYSCDHFGHGRSPGPRLGSKMEIIVKEIGAVVQFASRRNPGVPIILYGQAAGSLAILSYVLDKHLFYELVSGVLLESPWLVSWAQREIGLFETTFLLFMNYVMPTYIFDLKFTKYSTETSPLFIEKSEKCPLYFPYMSPKVYISAMKMITNVRAKSDSWPTTIPLIIAVGRDDTVLDANALIDFMNGMKRSVKNFDGRIYSCGHLLTKGRERGHFLEDAIDFFSSFRKKK